MTEKTKEERYYYAREDVKEKRKAGLKKYWENPDAKTSGDIPRQSRAIGNINLKLKELMPDAIENIGKVVRGEEVTKGAAEMSKWIVTMVLNNQKVMLENRAKKLEILSKEKKAKDDGVIPSMTPKEAAEDFGKPRLVLDFEEDSEESDEDIDD